MDDDAAIRDVFSLALNMEGYETCSANNGANALALIKQELPRLMLLDIMMPIMDGFQLLAELKTRKLNIPTIVITASASERTLSQINALEIEAVLFKPFSIEKLLTMVNDILMLKPKPSQPT